jgi:hypothetical protein
MINSDYYYTYKNSLRFLIILKLGKLYNKNTYSIPFLYKLSFFFSLSKSVDKDNISILIISIFLNFFLVKMPYYLNINLIII